MKRSVLCGIRNGICCLLFVLSFFELVLALPVLTLQHEQIQPGETILATINTSGEFMEYIDKSQIKFFQGRKQKTLESDILFYNQTHYLYIYADKEENLTLQIENILYREDGELKSITIKQNLTIRKNFIFDEEANETYTQILKIRPGFISAATKPKLKLTNMGTRTINFTFGEQEISIKPLLSEDLEFVPEEPFSLTKISTYKDFLIPTVYLSSGQNVTFISPAVKLDLRQDPELLLVETFTNTNTKETIKLFNFGDNNLTEMKTTSSIDFVEVEDLEDMQGRGIQNMTLTLNPTTPGHFQGAVNISYNQNGTNNILEIFLSIFVLPKGISTNNESFKVREETCQEILGEVCDLGFLCNGTAIFTKNAEYCCLDSCVKTEVDDSESSGFGWLVGIVIFVILGFVGNYFYQKQKRVRPDAPKDTLQKTTERFEKRMGGDLTQRTSGNLVK